MWLTEEKEGKVRIEQCGHQSIADIPVDARSNQMARKVLINMKARKGQMERANLRSE